MLSTRGGAAGATAHPESLRDAGGSIRPGWRTAFGSLIGLSFGPSVLQVMSLGVFTPYLRDEFGWGLGQISAAAMILAVMVTIVSPLQGLLVDRFGARRLILVSIPLFGFGYAALSLMSGAIWQFYLGWGLLPLLGLGLWPASYVKATSSWFDARLGLAIGVATVGIGIGAALAPMQIDMLAHGFGWRTAFAVIGLVSVAVAWPIAILFVKDRGRSATLAQERAIEQPTGDHRRATFWILFAAFLLLGLYSTAILVHFVTILEGNGMDRRMAVVAQSTLGVAMMAGRLGSGLLVDRISVRILMPIFAAGAVIALALLSQGVAGGGGFVAAVLIGILIGSEIDLLGFVVKRYFGSRRFGALYGVLFAVFQFGSAAGVIGVGATREITGSYMIGLVALMGACVGAAILFTLLGPYRYGVERGGDPRRHAADGEPRAERA